MKNSRLIYLSILSGLLLIPAWYEFGTGLILLFSMIPLLWVEDYLYQNKAEHRPHKAFLYGAITFFTWNAGATWWLWNASEAGMFMAFLINSLQMSIVFWLFHITRRNTSSAIGYFALITYWLVFEHFYMNGEINWPWLNLGNGFANDIHIIQWYEFTGSFGGTLWILLVNILGFSVLKHFILNRNLRGKLADTGILVTLIALPIIISLIQFGTYKEEINPKEIVVLQPNIDPYEDKFGGMDMSLQMDILLTLSDSFCTPETDYIVAPETFINDNVWAHEMYSNRSIVRIYDSIRKNHKQAAFIVGLTYYQLYTSADERTVTAQQIGKGDRYYDSYNAAIQIDTFLIPQVYKKSKLVVGVEKMPYPEYLGFLRKITLRLGGTFRSHGVQDQRENLYLHGDSTGISPVICYESVFGEYVTDYIRKGSHFIFVITNDGWWGDTPGYRQHHSFSRLRAIETRRSVARSANTGISSLISQKGEILQRTNYWEADAIRGSLNANDKLTFYTRHGDYIARIAYFFSLLIVLYTITRILMSRKKTA
ncbi:apolipoprotein N-acyltransferase [Bacteroidota bacterium]